MKPESARARARNDTRNRILDVSLEVLGKNPDAGMGEVATAAGVVRRTVYGYFPTRADLVRTITERAVEEIEAVLGEAADSGDAADEEWVEFLAGLWPLTHRYRVLLALRRGEYGEEIHTLLRPVDQMLGDLVRRGQKNGAFGKHLPADLLSQIAYTAVFSIADSDDPKVDARAATITSLLLLGVPQARAEALADRRG